MHIFQVFPNHRYSASLGSFQFLKQIIYNMKQICQPASQQQDNPSQLQTHFFSCCIHNHQNSQIYTPDLPKKTSRFIQLTINKPKVLKQTPKSEASSVSVLDSSSSRKQIYNFEEDKLSFLQQIRNYNTNLENGREKQSVLYGKGLSSSKEMDTSLKSNENTTLSSLLESISNEIFSEMFVSSTVKGKIEMSGSLGSIAEVKSDMEKSCPTESIVNMLHFGEER